MAAVTSALARARATMATRLPERSQQAALRDLGDDRVRALVDAFVAAWERSDVAAVVALLAEDVVMAMPPFGEWFAGRADVADFLAPRPLGGPRWSCRASSYNGQPAVVHYLWEADVEAFLAHSLSVLSLGPDGITALNAFLDPALVGCHRP